MFHLAHLSDIHLGPLPGIRARDLMSKRVTGYVNWRRNRSGKLQPEILAQLVADMKARRPDFVAITGDLINLGLDAEFGAARRWLDDLGDPERTMLVCGNHDAYVPGALKKALAQWQPYVSGDDGRTIAGAVNYPVLRRRGKVSLIACNSARASLPFLAAGYFRKAQAGALLAMLEEEGRIGQCRVVLIHHPPIGSRFGIHTRLNGANLFRRAIAKAGAELVLHGHTHLASTGHIPGLLGPAPVIGVPSACEAGNGRRPAARYNWFEIGKKAGKLSILMREFGFAGPGLPVTQISERRLPG